MSTCWAYSRGRLCGALLLLTAAAVPVPAQSFGTDGRSAAAPLAAAAARTATPPAIDGRDDEAVWDGAPVIDQFRLYTPTEGAIPAFRTEARVLYDDRALYVLVRAYDPRPDSVVRRLTRRDAVDPSSDVVLLFLDPYLDRRSGYAFVVNAAGVKQDALLFDDTGEDPSWDGVWEAATGVDARGWLAEYAIPFKQLRFSARPETAFGIMIGRWVGRTGERGSWPQYSLSRAGLPSQFGVLTGLKDLPRSGGAELMPYASVRGRNVREGVSHADEIEARPAAGGDLRWVPRPSVTVDATVNPDFGEVESDPAVLDLSGAEVFRGERRPFFVQSAALGIPLASDGTAQFFYSRRIGRRPTLRDAYGGADSPTETTVLGAARLAARLPATTSVAVLSALTQREEGGRRPDGEPYVLEPFSHYGVVRVQRDMRHGRSGVGMMLTRVDRSTRDSLIAATLPALAQALILTTQHQTADGHYRLSAWGAASDIRGDPDAMLRLQLSTVHAFQRPDDAVALDPTRSTLRGTAALLSIGKVGGGSLRYGASYRRIQPGFDVNDLGFIAETGTQSASAGIGVQVNGAGALAGMRYRRAELTLDAGGSWTTAGLPLARGLAIRGFLQFPSQVQVQATAAAQLGGAYCTVTCTRGGPALVDLPERSLSLDVTGDPRGRLLPHATLTWRRDDDGRSQSVSAQADAAWHIRPNLDVSLAALVENAVQASQFYARFGDPASDTAHYTVARLDRRTRSLTARLNYTISPLLTAQWYAQGYISRGAYADVRELADPRSPDWSARFRPYADPAVAASPGGIDYKQLRSNVVLRWEYRPGSALFLVWGHGRDLDGGDPATPGIWPGRDVRDLFRLPAHNTVILKASYWLSW